MFGPCAPTSYLSHSSHSMCQVNGWVGKQITNEIIHLLLQLTIKDDFLYSACSLQSTLRDNKGKLDSVIFYYLLLQL